MPDETKLLAVLIDADNTSPKYAKALFDEIASLGEASVRRCYGDFSSNQMAGWSKVTAEFGLVPTHQPANTVGKNASDIALVIDAMDLMHSGRFDGFCLVSSDSDFTRLASRLREQGLDVFGIGMQKTPEAFRKAWAEDSEKAYAALVDELLASPRFGERWARHWLDKARYAELIKERASVETTYVAAAASVATIVEDPPLDGCMLVIGNLIVTFLRAMSRSRGPGHTK